MALESSEENLDGSCSRIVEDRWVAGRKNGFSDPKVFRGLAVFSCGHPKTPPKGGILILIHTARLSGSSTILWDLWHLSGTCVRVRVCACACACACGYRTVPYPGGIRGIYKTELI